MKLLKISANGLPLFDGGFEIDFLAKQRTTSEDKDKMGYLFSGKQRSFYQNNVIGFIGINAAGKTTVLRLLSFVCRMLNNEPINRIDCGGTFDGLIEGDQAIFDVYFVAGDTVNLLHTVIEKRESRLIIADEFLKSKVCDKVKSRDDVFDFSEISSTIMRDNNEAYLLDDVSVMIAFNKSRKSSLSLADMLYQTDNNKLTICEDCPPELIAFFDSSVEYLRISKIKTDTDIRLKFHSGDEMILSALSDLNRYLSSGTIKGINTFMAAIKVFQTGGYLVIDELENHFDHEIVSTLVRFYTDPKVNPKGAVLVFSTHYAELLDEFERNDCVFIVQNNGGITISNFADLMKRNDIKKSEIYQSGYLGKTVPSYDSYIALKKSLAHFVLEV